MQGQKLIGRSSTRLTINMEKKPKVEKGYKTIKAGGPILDTGIKPAGIGNIPMDKIAAKLYDCPKK